MTFVFTFFIIIRRRAIIECALVLFVRQFVHNLALYICIELIITVSKHSSIRNQAFSVGQDNQTLSQKNSRKQLMQAIVVYCN